VPVETSAPLANGLPIHRLSLPGTRAVTILVAFEAGARTERPEENGMAHFLEHLVFKGGEKYDDYRKVNETAEHLGAVLNAYTSHDVVAFHITCRAEVAPDAIDLLTDFVGRPKIDPEELDRERGVVIQEIARAQDTPAVVGAHQIDRGAVGAEHLIDRAAFGDHPLGRPVLGPEDHLRTFTREAIVAFRERQWAGSRGGAFLAGNLEHLPADDVLADAFGRFPAIEANGGFEPASELEPTTLVEERDSNQSHLRMSYRPSIDIDVLQQRAALAVCSTLLGGSMGSRLFDEIREQRGLAYSVYSIAHSFADVGVLQLSAGLESGKCIEAYERMREIVDELRTDGPTDEEVQRARAYAAGRMVLSFENTNAVARHASQQKVVFGRDLDPDASIAALDAVTVADVREVAAGISEELSVACVGPHSVDEFA
jgi:predicted Zn-dependent peptidase